ncbi:MAG: substrate-binding domain-containing protein [Fimbriimonadia bacterium]|jgi:L-arabinose transport system substrate-binding protein
MRRTASLAVVAFGLLLFGCNPDTKNGTNQNPSNPGGGPKDVKIGFIVKSMADSWFQSETSFAKEKAKELGAELIVQEALNGNAVLTTIDSMATNGCQGIIICSPEVQLGSAIKAAAARHDMKLMSVDDRLVGGDGKPLTDIPHLGIDAYNIGKQVGQAIVDEMGRRGWKPDEVAGLAITAPALETARQRVNGAKEVLLANGFRESNIFEAPWTGSVDIAAASDAANGVLTARSHFRKWVVFSSNDDGVLGGIRAISNRGIPATGIIGVGINGALAAAEWAKGTPTGMVASVLLQPRVHGADTVEMMYRWITEGKEPPKETYTTGTIIDKNNYKEALKKQGLSLP